MHVDVFSLYILTPDVGGQNFCALARAVCVLAGRKHFLSIS